MGGIGPEVALKAAYDKRWPASLKLVLVGAASITFLARGIVTADPGLLRHT